MPLRRPLLAALLAAPALARAQAPRPGPWRGLHLVQVPGFSYGGADARYAMRQTLPLGADAVVLLPSLWQSGPAATEVLRGGDLDPEGLAEAIRQARASGLRVLVRPLLWVEGGRPETARPADEAGWRRWFASYGQQVTELARLAQEVGAEAFAAGSGLGRSVGRPEWRGLLDGLRGTFRGRLLYMASSPEEAEAIPFWERLDGIGLRLYPALGRDDGPEEWTPVMRREAERLDRLAARLRRRVWVELGIRSAAGAAARPWETAEERRSLPDPRVQAQVLAHWLRALDRPAVEALLLWRWFTDPGRGGPEDTDFTLQGKLAEGVLMGAWTR
ncbi:hypothetical protein JMJ55_22375 [Belnapia sp. T6]|uniref:Glycoside hydrolase family 5 domain-containing protein n=1 Tax=Belnapia mucosa TaxID=2804532 RepID=A0ABS1V8U4_9PROT|nr:hypothetical protein [Belnapia mucosa]MBL6458087.1 hypothetical protein [Belnapia mucosa]